ncbi:MAG: DUF2062 domain-containing protein [Pseudomonadales bacterium]
MPKKFIQRFIPAPETVARHPSLRWLGDHLHDPNIWHLNRQSVSLAVLIGLFCAFIPLPTQMIFAAILALWLRANLPVAIALVWLTNPVTIPPVFFATYKLGAWMLDIEPLTIQFEASWAWFSAKFAKVWQPLVLGSLCCGVVAGGLGYAVVLRIWRWSVISRWEERKKMRAALKKSEV